MYQPPTNIILFNMNMKKNHRNATLATFKTDRKGNLKDLSDLKINDLD